MAPIAILDTLCTSTYIKVLPHCFKSRISVSNSACWFSNKAIRVRLSWLSKSLVGLLALLLDKSADTDALPVWQEVSWWTSDVADAANAAAISNS